jgi:myo-inositol-1-phosphate synthase
MTDGPALDHRVRVAIAGVGNCASSLVQAVVAARTGDARAGIGIAHPLIGAYRVADIEFVAAYDVDERKIGRDLSAAIRSAPNCTTNYIDVPVLGVRVECGPLVDGVGPQTSDVVQVADEALTTGVEEVTESLRATGADVLICYLPVGSAKATLGYAEAALAAGVAFVNCNPELVAADPEWQARFSERGLPLLGDDIKSQLGATTLHRMLIDLCSSRGAAVDRTYQLNVGGNTDFLNMRDPGRAASKRTSKMSALRSELPEGAEFGAGPSDYVPHLADRKVAYITLEGRSLLGMPFIIEAKLSVEDSPNSAGVAIDAVRAAKVALDRGLSGPVNDVCGYLFKTPPIRYPDAAAAALIERFSAEDEQG